MSVSESNVARAARVVAIASGKHKPKGDSTSSSAATRPRKARVKSDAK